MQGQCSIPNETKRLSNISRRLSRSSDEADHGDLTLLSCRTWQGNVQIFITHVHDHCFCSLNLLFADAVFSRERFTTVTAYRGFVTKSQLLETLFTRN